MKRNRNIQLNIFDDMNSKQTLKFQVYHKMNPKVYEQFKNLSIKTMKLGHKSFSARGVFQVMRWKFGGDIKDDGYKFNNNYTPYYVRLLQQEMPIFKGFFETRIIKKKTA